jgi:hypothetical protein
MSAHPSIIGYLRRDVLYSANRPEREADHSYPSITELIKRGMLHFPLSLHGVGTNKVTMIFIFAQIKGKE